MRGKKENEKGDQNRKKVVKKRRFHFKGGCRGEGGEIRQGGVEKKRGVKRGKKGREKDGPRQAVFLEKTTSPKERKRRKQ